MRKEATPGADLISQIKISFLTVKTWRTQSNQPINEMETSDMSIVREVEPPTARQNQKKKVPFNLWFEDNKHLFPQNPEIQDGSEITEKEYIFKTHKMVDEQGEKEPAKPKRKKKMMPFDLAGLTHPLTVEISDFNTEKQSVSIVTDSTFKPQERNSNQSTSVSRDQQYGRMRMNF